MHTSTCTHLHVVCGVHFWHRVSEVRWVHLQGGGCQDEEVRAKRSEGGELEADWGGGRAIDQGEVKGEGRSKGLKEMA